MARVGQCEAAGGTYRADTVVRTVESHMGRDGGLLDLYMRVMAVQIGQNQDRARMAEENFREERHNIRSQADGVVKERNKSAKSQMYFAMIGGMFGLAGATSDKFLPSAWAPESRKMAGEMFKTLGTGLQAGTSINNVQVEAKVYNMTTEVSLAQQQYEVNWTRHQEHKGGNRNIREDAQQLLQQIGSWINRLWNNS